MTKLAVLKFGKGNFSTGFPVTLRLGTEAASPTLELDGHLPPAPALLELAKTWQFSYRSRGMLGGSLRQLKTPKTQITRQRSSLVTVSKDWVEALNDWLNQGDRQFQPLRDQLLKVISHGDSVRLTIQAEQLELWQLPWHLWNLVHDHANIDVTFSLNTYASSQSTVGTKNSQIRILVLLGDRTNIDIEKDLNLLRQQLINVDVYCPASIQREQLCQALWRQSWDILFFAGHSSSQPNEGRFYLTPDVYLTIEDLRYALQRAIANGLQLAIFNSCDGLELARQLADLNLPAAIVMREPIPDQAAQQFLHYFLTSFAHTEFPLHLAVRDAREQLHAALDNKFPCASWLPVVYQSPASPSLTWRSLQPAPSLPDPTQHSTALEPSPPPRSRVIWQTALTTSLMVLGAVWGVRSLGWLEPAELWAYDQMMRLRPQLEEPDDRLLIVGITDADLERYGVWDSGVNRPILSDRTLAQALTQLQRHRPRLIGVDIIRDIPLGSGIAGQTELLQTLRSQNVVSPCKMGSDDGNLPGHAPPPSIPARQLGYINFANEPIVRQHLLKMSADNASICPIDDAFSTRLAVRYLGITEAVGTPQLDIQIGTKILPVIRTHVGGYQSSDSRSKLAYGYHFLLNYRAAPNIAEQISLTQLLTGQINAEWIENKLILVGYLARTANDFHPTPFSQNNSIEQKMPGVVIHAHMISQILSAVEDNRPLLQPWSTSSELLWIGLWSVLGGLLALRWRSLTLIYIGGFTLIVLIGSSFILFWCGVWVPCIPAGLAVISSVGSLVLQTRLQAHFSNRKGDNHGATLPSLG